MDLCLQKPRPPSLASATPQYCHGLFARAIVDSLPNHFVMPPYRLSGVNASKKNSHKKHARSIMLIRSASPHVQDLP